jgi:hypothetical protein
VISELGRSELGEGASAGSDLCLYGSAVVSRRRLGKRDGMVCVEKGRKPPLSLASSSIGIGGGSGLACVEDTRLSIDAPKGACAGGGG